MRAPVAAATAATPPGGPPAAPTGPPVAPTGPPAAPTGPPPVPSGPPPVTPPVPGGGPTPGSPNRTWVALAALALVTVLVVVLIVAGTSGKKSTVSPAGTTAPTSVPATPSTTKPSTTKPSDSSTTAPKTTVPSSTIPGGLTLSESCTSPDYGFSLDYPGGWYAEKSFPGWQCALFDSSPFVVQPDTEVPPVEVLAAVYEYPFDPSVAMYTDPSSNELLSSSDLTVDGHKAVAVEIVTLQDGLEPAGTSRYAVLVDFGSNRTFVIEASSARGDDYTIDKQVVRAMANSLMIPD